MLKAGDRGTDSDGIAKRFSSILRRVLEDLVVTAHVYRGNFRSTIDALVPRD